ncbi:Hypothetical predicted protein [Marmota monax]|uniref:Uncharacterized protein n=1 Tax=Marmota monax TaxID=9995 RepID=A0A5E4CTZ0_MARMO|nr:hypothetical protein GHT09_008771 [Marmota monax]VTJ84619.1 Hypothetical predicted protein [Marmota monax]
MHSPPRDQAAIMLWKLVENVKYEDIYEVLCTRLSPRRLAQRLSGWRICAPQSRSLTPPRGPTALPHALFHLGLGLTRRPRSSTANERGGRPGGAQGARRDGKGRQAGPAEPCSGEE